MYTISLIPVSVNNLDIKLVNILHDELVFEIEESDASIAVSIIEEVMVAGFLMSFPEAQEMTTDLVEVNTGCNWYEAK